MGRFRSLGLRLAVAVLSISAITGCGGGSHPGPPLFPGHINLNPSATVSLTVGSTLGFAATVQTASGTNLATTVTYTSSDTSILNLAPNGVACAGHWDAAFTTCSPGATGLVTVTASALGGNSVPTDVFVHPEIDNIAVVGVVQNGAPVQEPCLSESQSMTVEAHAYSHGTDITTSVGPFTWSANNASVVTLTPLTNNAFNFPTNQATATANAPGITYIYASANGASSNSFQQPQLTNSQGTPSPVLDFFATCAIQNIALELGAAGSAQTSFSVAKGSTSGSQTVVATVTDIMGYNSLPRTDGGLVLSKVPLTWTSSQPRSIGTPGTGCSLSCALSLPSPGSATITASCSPPTCNVGFPLIPASLSTSTQITDCNTFFQAIYPEFLGCQALIPVPVYASPVFINPPNSPVPLSNAAAISGVVTGSTSPATVFASSTGCALEPPSSCNTFGYNVTTASSAGNATQFPVSPNSFVSDPTGNRVWMGSDFGAEIVNPSAFGSANPAFTPLGTVTGTVLASSLNGTLAAFSDTKHIPNQVYIVSSTSPSSPTALTIPNAQMAAFTPDGLKTYIVGETVVNNAAVPALYIYSPLQALQGPFTLTGTPKAISFSPNGAFTYIAEASLNNSAPTLDVFSNCNNQPAGSITLSTAIPPDPRADPILMKVLPALPRGSTAGNIHCTLTPTTDISGCVKDSYGFPIPPDPDQTSPQDIHVLILDSTGFDIANSAILPPTAGSLCSQGIQFLSNDPSRAAQRIELGQGTLKPLNFFFSSDNTLLYVVNSTSSSIIVYSLVNGAVVGGIPLQNNATPLTADISPDGGTIVIAGSDGLLHEVSTAVGGSDATPISFPNAPNSLNPFCSFTPTAGPCTLNVAQAKQ